MSQSSFSGTARVRPVVVSSRLPHIDGLRGVAIFTVVLFHAYARWPDLMPFGARYVATPMSVGWVGVELFFMISGFVIFMTLERSRSFAVFAVQRWRRLFPAMLTTTVLIVVTAPLLPERPQGAIDWLDPLVGLTLIDPKWWSVLGLDVKPVEGAFWSLFIEVQFYAVVGLSFFAFGRVGALTAIVTVFGLSIFAASGFLAADSLLQRGLLGVMDRLGGLHYGWFIAGSALFLYTQTAGRHMLLLAVAALATSVVIATGPGSWLGSKVALVGVAGLFLSALWWGPLQRHLELPFWQFLGTISYPLYLVHENLIVALTVKLSKALPTLPADLLPLIGIGISMLVAWLIAHYAEPAVRRMLPLGKVIRIERVTPAPAQPHLI